MTVCSWPDPGPGERTGDWELSCAPAPGAWRPWRLLRAKSWLRREVRRTRPQVVHVHSLGVHGLLSLLLPTRAAPRVVTPWGSELKAAARHRGRALVARLALRRADLVLPTSREVAATVANRYRVPQGTVTVLSWGVPDHLLDQNRHDHSRQREEARLTRAKYGIPADATLVTSIRSTSPVYRTREIVDAFAEAAPRRPDLHLVLVTGHRPSHPAAARAQQHYLATLHPRAAQLPGRVTVIDQLISQSELFALMRASEVAVSVPSADQRSSSILEAAAAGCRLLLADIAPYRELVADGLHADLLTDPLGIALAESLTGAAPLRAADRWANQELIGRTERASAQTTRLERLFEQVAGRRTGRGKTPGSRCP